MSTCNFGEQVLYVPGETKAAIFDFYTSGRLRRERNLYQKGKQRSNGKRGEGWKNTKITQANPQRVKLFFERKDNVSIIS